MGFEWGGESGTPDERVDQTLRAVHAELQTLREKELASDEILAYAKFLLEVAGKAVRGSASGGILGLGKQEVSRRESVFLNQLDEVLEAGLPGCEGCIG